MILVGGGNTRQIKLVRNTLDYRSRSSTQEEKEKEKPTGAKNKEED